VQRNKDGEQKFFKLFGHFSLALILSATSLNAESFADFKKSQAESFAQYKDERDNEFNKYLKQQWKAYSVLKGKDRYEEPKPKVIPPTKQTKIKSVGPKVSIKVKKIKPTPVQKKSVVPKKQPIVQKTLTPKVAKVTKPTTIVVTKPMIMPIVVPDKDINFNFYGTKLGFNIPLKIKNANFHPQNQKGITGFFESAASSDYENLIDEIEDVKNDMNLNDWATYLLVLKVSDQVYKNQDNAKLLSWFIFNKLGYAVKVGLAQKNVVLMHYSKKTIYSTPNYSFGKRKFYVLSHYSKGSVGRLFSYKQDYPGSTKALDLSLSTLPYLVSDTQSKTLSFKEYGTTYKIPFEYNKNLIDFMATYPQADYETYFNAPVDGRTYKSIAEALKRYVDGMQAGDAMNFVLHFVQKSFDYSKDNAQFKREKVMFAQETLYFDKSDCEDRAVLFSYLVKELFGIGVVGVHYKGHMATALYVPMKGDYIEAGSRKFVVADPTYINSNIGQSMPKYKSSKPENFIVVK